jgi:hypothetical protein
MDFPIPSFPVPVWYYDWTRFYSDLYDILKRDSVSTHYCIMQASSPVLRYIISVCKDWKLFIPSDTFCAAKCQQLESNNGWKNTFEARNTFINDTDLIEDILTCAEMYILWFDPDYPGPSYEPVIH